MRLVEFDKFRELIGASPDTKEVLEEVLEANNIEYESFLFSGESIDDGDLDSMIELNNWNKNVHCAVFHRNVIYKSRSVGYSTMGQNMGLSCWITLINNVSLDHLVEIYKRTMKLKAFL